MKLFNRPSNTSKGFTLIELLIVIALIGALAVGLLAALDPVDQIRRANDVNRQNIAKEYAGAQQRYFVSNNAYAGGDILTSNAAVNLNTAPVSTAITNNLIPGGELKSGWTAGSNAANVYVHQESTTGLVTTYYLLQSKSFKNNTSITKCNITLATGVVTACQPNAVTCTSATNNCFGQLTN